MAESPRVLEFLEPILAVPRIAEDAVTIGVRIGDISPPSALRYRVYPSAGIPPEFVERTYDESRLEFVDYFTWDGLSPGVLYTVEVLGITQTGNRTITTTLNWNPEANLFPAVDSVVGAVPRQWEFEDFAPQWFALLAWYYRNEPMLSALYARIADEMQRLDTAIEEVTRFIFPAWAYGGGIERWEDLYEIEMADSSEHTKRAVILILTAARLRASAASFAKAITTLQGGVPAVITEDFANYSLNVLIQGSASTQEVIKEVVRRIKPAHLDVSFEASFFAFSGPRRRQRIGALHHRARAAQPPNNPAFNRGKLS